MKQFDATDIHIDFVQCAVCEKGITGGNWFARIKHGEQTVALCCPLCTEAFERNPGPYMRRSATYGLASSRSIPEGNNGA